MTSRENNDGRGSLDYILNLYSEDLDPTRDDRVSLQEYHKVLERLLVPPPPTPLGCFFHNSSVSHEHSTSCRMAMLRQQALVLFTPGLNPSRDTNILEWANIVLLRDLEVEIEQVCALGKSIFLIVLTCSLYRSRILASTLLYLGK